MTGIKSTYVYIGTSLTRIANKCVNGTVDFPQCSGHASITPKREKNDAYKEHEG
mgnify:CR=1 FL=1